MGRALHIAATPLIPLLVLLEFMMGTLAWILSFFMTLGPLKAWNPFPKNFYSAIPFTRLVYNHIPPWQAAISTYCFEFIYTWRCLFQWLTKPLRRQLPSFYIVGFPKAGTTSVANHLKTCPGIGSVDGLRSYMSEILRKESHFFMGIQGRANAHKPGHYSIMFPTYLSEWAAIVLQGAKKYMVFDACPAAVWFPHVAERIARMTPDAKIIIMLRDPIEATYSAETMFFNLRMHPGFAPSTEGVQPNDPRYKQDPEFDKAWQSLELLGPEDPIPEGVIEKLYLAPQFRITSGKLYDRVLPFLRHFSKEQILFISFDDLKRDEEGVVRQVLRFVGAEEDRFKYVERPAGMKGVYGSEKMHPSVRALLQQMFADSNQKLQAMLGRNFGWGAKEVV